MKSQADSYEVSYRRYIAICPALSGKPTFQTEIPSELTGTKTVKDVVNNKFRIWPSELGCNARRKSRGVAMPHKDMVNNKFRIWIVRFGRTASLQIAYVAGPHRAICA